MRTVRPRLATALVAGYAAVLASAAVATPAHAAAASITAPTTGKAGGFALLGGANWPAYANVNVYLVKTSSTFLCTMHADSAGTLAAQTCTLPTYLIAGQYTVHADDTHGNTDDAPAPLTLKPMVTGSIFHIAAGTNVTLTGHGFAPSSAITVKLGASTLATAPASVTTDTNGTFSGVTVTVPAAQAVGQISLTSTDGLANTASTPLQVFRPTLSAPATAPSASTAVFSGTGWPIADAVSIYYSRAGSSNSFVCTLHSDDSGVIPQTGCTTPAYLAAGTASFFATDNAVTTSKPTAITPSVIANSTFNTQQAPSVAAGSTLSLVGHGYAASSALTVKLGTKTLVASPVTATDGNGTFTTTVTIPTGQAQAKITLTISDAAANKDTVKLFAYHAHLIAPASAPAGSTQLFDGDGWPPLASLGIYVRAGTTNNFICTIHADESGDVIPQVCTLPTYLVGGAYTFVASDGYVTTSSNAFTMQAAISVTNTSNQPMAGGAVGDAVHLAGYSFTASSTVSVKLGNKVINTVPATPTTSTSGGFNGVSFSVPNVAAGTYTLAVTDAAGVRATAQFTVS